jgi:hypothetical protein
LKSLTAIDSTLPEATKFNGKLHPMFQKPKVPVEAMLPGSPVLDRDADSGCPIVRPTRDANVTGARPAVVGSLAGNVLGVPVDGE